MATERMTLGAGHSTTEEEHLARYRFATRLVRGLDVADIACGTGYGSKMLAEGGAQSVHGMDLSETTVKECRSMYGDDRVHYSVGDAQALKHVPDLSFDLVVSFETIEHLPDVKAYLDEMMRVLRPGGRFLVSTPDRRLSSMMYPFTGRSSNPFHLREYTLKELRVELGRRFIIEAEYGQRFVPRWLVLWPVQLGFKAICRAPGMGRLRRLKDSIYSHGGSVEVLEKQGSQVAKFWVMNCRRP